MKKLILFFNMIMVGVCFTSAKQWTVKMETSVQTMWKDVDTTKQYDQGSTQGSTQGPTRTLTVNAETKSDAMDRARNMCYDACDSDWVPVDLIQEDGHTYRVYKKVFLTNYYIDE